MYEEPYSHPRWWDNPMPVSSLCEKCIYCGPGVTCEKYPLQIPDELYDKSFPGAAEFDENYCPDRTEKDKI